MNETFPFAAPPVLLIKEGRGKYRAATPKEVLCAAHEAADAVYQRGEKFESPEAVKRFFIAKLAGYEREVFAVTWLDQKHRLIAYEELFMGSVASSEVKPREVIKGAIRNNAAAAIIGHNHPSGNPTPSDADAVITATIKGTLKVIDVNLLDHIVVGGNLAKSFVDEGRM